MEKEDLIISLLKSKESTTELFNDNRQDNEISDIRRIINRLKDILRILRIRKLRISFIKQKIKEMFQKKKEKERMNTLENQ